MGERPLLWEGGDLLVERVEDAEERPVGFGRRLAREEGRRCGLDVTLALEDGVVRRPQPVVLHTRPRVPVRKVCSQTDRKWSTYEARFTLRA